MIPNRLYLIYNFQQVYDLSQWHWHFIRAFRLLVKRPIVFLMFYYYYFYDKVFSVCVFFLENGGEKSILNVKFLQKLYSSSVCHFLDFRLIFFRLKHAKYKISKDPLYIFYFLIIDFGIRYFMLWCTKS